MPIVRHQFSPNFFIVLFIFFALLFAHHETLYSQDNQSADASKLQQVSTEAVLYEIRFTRLQRMAAEFVESYPDSSLPAELIELIRDAKELSKEGDFDLASDLLDEAMIFFNSEMVQVGVAKTKAPNSDPSGYTEWTKYIFSGSDLWEQKFNLALGEQDSTIIEGQGNPFIGLRLRMDYAHGALSHTQAEFEAKHSRDYFTGMLLLDHRQTLSQKVHTKFENRFEATSYRRDSDLKYIDDKLDLGIFIHLNNTNTLEFANEIQVRDYAQQSDLYTSFMQNRAIATLSFVPFSLTRLDVDYEFRSRKHNYSPQMNYFEHRLGLNSWQGLASNVSTLLLVQWRERRYLHPESDSLLAKNYNHFYSEFNLRLNLTQTYSIYLDSDLEIRRYNDPSSVIPNYWELTIAPSCAVSLLSPLSVRGGYRFRTRRHSAYSDDATAEVEIENYTSHGPTVAVDLFTLSGLIVSLQDNYEFRRYPNSISKGIADFTLYSDRNVNSLFLFLSWNFSTRWELDLIANLDHDNDTKDDNGDARSTLFTIELAYRF